MVFRRKDRSETPPKVKNAKDDLAIMNALAADYRQPLVRFLAKRLGNVPEAEDIAQEVFVRIVQRGDVETIEHAQAFLFQTAMNLLRDKLRYDTAHQYWDHDVYEDSLYSAEGPSPERVIQARERLRKLEKALQSLDERARDIFILHRLENMKYRDIADRYGISVSAIEKYMMKALAHIQRRMR